MHPILLKFGPFTLYSYGVTLVIAFLVVTWLASRAARRLPPELRAIPAEQVADFSCLSLLGGLLGARLFYVGLHWEWFADSPQDIPAIWQGGLVWYGGLLGGTLAAWLYARAKRLVLLRVMDLFIPFVVLGHAIGRLGCFLNGCCYGKSTERWCGVVFPVQPTAVLPTQLFEALGLLVLFLSLRTLQPTTARGPGWLLGVYLVSYAILRFFMEFLRGDQTTWWMGLTLQQLISLVLLLVGVGLFRRNFASRNF